MIERTRMTGLYYLVACFFGLAAGSFINAWIWRARENLAIVASRSMCPHCRERIVWRDNIPVISFILLRGRCRHCRCRISWQYPAVEIVTALLFMAAAYFFPAESAHASLRLVSHWIILLLLTFTFVYDLRYGEILDQATAIPALILLPVSLWAGWQSWSSLFIGILAGSGLFLALYLLSRGAWIGGGDVRLGFFMGVILGWPRILVALLLAYVLGAGVSLVLIVLRQKTMRSTTPFGTYLAIGAVTSLFFGQRLIDWYLGLM